MDLAKNPFYILGATTRHDRRRLVELAEEQSLLLDPEACARARADLTNPRKRLTAEVAWLPGVDVARGNEVVGLLEDEPEAMLSESGLTPMARANLIAAGITVMVGDGNLSADDALEMVPALAYAFEEVDAEEVQEAVNEDRAVAGFPEVTDVALVEEEVSARREHFRTVVRDALDTMPSQKLVETLTCIVETVTEEGEEPAPALIDDLVDAYEVEAQEFLRREEERIEAQVQRVRKTAEGGALQAVLAPQVRQLAAMVKQWDLVAQPIQVSARGRGLDHDASHRIAAMVRSLSVDLWNEHEELALSQSLTKTLQEVFAEVDTVAERVEEDADALENIARGQRRSAAEEARWREEITYTGEWGLILKKRISISPDGIDWNRRRYPLERISRVRWGGTRHSTNGVYTGTTFKIGFGGPNIGSALIELKAEHVFARFTQCLWRGVGVRILTEYLEGLREGKQYQWGDMTLHDNGVTLVRHRMFRANEEAFCPWGEVHTASEGGSYGIAWRKDRRFVAAFSYQDNDNIHVLSALLDMAMEKGYTRLTQLMGR